MISESYKHENIICDVLPNIRQLLYCQSTAVSVFYLDPKPKAKSPEIDSYGSFSHF